jgi:GNAT superfamily N-acetyltransferase
VVLQEPAKKCRISPVFVLPEFQCKGIAQQMLVRIEALYARQNGWILDTIEQEAGNCYLYEKLGYRKTGQVEQLKPGMTIVYYAKPPQDQLGAQP